jgi:hypothetical protein
MLPDPFPETDISHLPASQHVQHKGVYVRGDPAALPAIVQRSIEFALRYSQILGSGDLQAAYALTDSGLQSAMTFEQFEQEHQDAQREFGGPALEFQIERFAFVLTDSAARNKSNTSHEGWHKGTAKENRRCRLIGFWVRNRQNNSGCRGSMWLSEQDGDNRLANFDFYRK